MKTDPILSDAPDDIDAVRANAKTTANPPKALQAASRARVKGFERLVDLYRIVKAPHACVVLGTAVLWLGLVGCDRRVESLDAFLTHWHQTMMSGRGEELYPLLDIASQRRVRQDLEVMRGLSNAAQRAVLDQLDAPSVPDLNDLTAAQYFALLWQSAVGGKSLRVDTSTDRHGSVTMILTLDEKKSFLGSPPTLRVPLVVEGGQWKWQLPAQSQWSRPPPRSDQEGGEPD